MALLLRLTLTVCLIIFTGGGLAAIDWPIDPPDQSHPIGNSYGEFQCYGGSPYMHPGIDIMAPAGTPVYAIKSGYVKAVLTIYADLHWRVAIGDSAGAAECDGWLYAHLDKLTIPVNEGDWVEEGQYIGDLVQWPVAGFHHLHFVKIRHSGLVWDSDWEFIDNPLDELNVIDDPDAPVFEMAYGNQKFAFCRNVSADYFQEGELLEGGVDIVCRVYDYINHYDWKLTPHRIEYMIDGDSAVPWTNSVCFTGLLDYDHNVEVIYQVNGALQSRGDYNSRVFYFNATNTDGDSIIEASDRPNCWETANFHNGSYTVYIRAYDRAGNSTIDSMDVYLGNFFSLSGHIFCGDGDPDSSGSVVTVLSGGISDTTDSSGYFSLPLVGGGSQAIEISRVGYETGDTVLMMNRNGQLELMLAPNYIVGDANHDSEINLGDVVYLVNYVFKEGPSPIPFYSGNANSDGMVNLGDAVYLVNYIFRDGPAPVSFKN